ncbi:MAG: hypothetical protein H6974_04080 [Gammaproteobacteria bacterium]|nr:hypothetical protein [Gammaproteobacteria bacterium]MCP5195959.1 hypothetical protein [Gammaproteobacteria bacterium]
MSASDFPKYWPLLLGILLGLLSASYGALGDPQEQRVQIGLRLFRTLLAADRDLEKKVNAAGQLELALLYRDDRKRAEEFATALQTSGHGGQQGKVKNYPLQFILTDDKHLKELRQTPAAIYLIQPLSDAALETVIRYGVDHQRIVFSPFAGHVEKGILAGLVIEVRVMPYINRTTLQQSGIQLNQLLLKVAKIHD